MLLKVSLNEICLKLWNVVIIMFHLLAHQSKFIFVRQKLHCDSWFSHSRTAGDSMFWDMTSLSLLHA